MTAPALAAMARMIRRAEGEHQEDITRSIASCLVKDYAFGVILPMDPAKPCYVHLKELRGGLEAKVDIQVPDSPSTRALALAQAMEEISQKAKARSWDLIRKITGTSIPVEVG